MKLLKRIFKGPYNNPLFAVTGEEHDENLTLIENEIEIVASKVNILQEKNITGVQVVKNYANRSDGNTYLPAVGVAGISYKVANDIVDPTKNGYWSWSGGVYGKDAVSANGSVVSGNVDAVNGNTVNDVTKYKANLGIGKNRFNINSADVLIGKYLSTAGAISSSASYNITNYIPVLPNTQYAMTYRHNIAWYDANKVLVLYEASSANNIPISPANAYYLRCTVGVASWAGFQLEIGGTVTAFEAYKLTIPANELNLTGYSLKSEVVALENSKLSISKSANLINSNAILAGSYLGGTGIISPNAIWYLLQDFIPLNSTQANIISNFYAVTSAGGFNAYYDSNKNFISSFQGGLATWFTGVAYVRFSATAPPTNKMANYGTILLTYVEYTDTYQKVNEASIVDNSISASKIKSNAITTSKILNGQVTDVKTDLFAVGDNLFNINDVDVALGKYIALGTGILSTNASYNATGFIPIEGSTSYFVYWSHQCAFYDENKVFISGLNSPVQPMVSPANARFYRQGVLTTYWNVWQMNKGTFLLPYTAYGVFLKDKYVKPTTATVPFIPQISLPRRMHVLLNNENSIYHKAYVEKYNPYKCLIKASGTNWERQKRFIRLNASSAGNLTISTYDSETFAVQRSNTITVLSGNPITNNGNKIINVIGDSFSYNGYWLDKANSLCPNLTFVGMRNSYNTTLKAEGRGGWSLATYMTSIKGGATDSFSPYLHPIAPYKYYGGTAFWKQVKAGDTGYGVLGFTGIATTIGFDANGVKTTPVTNDVMWNDVNARYERYNGTAWELILEATLNFTFNYEKYLDTWGLTMPDYVGVMLGANDFRTSVPSVATLAVWGGRMDALITSVLNAGIAKGKVVRVAILLPTTETASDNNSIYENPAFQRYYMWVARKYIIDTFDNDTYLNAGVDVVDTGSALDGDFGFAMTAKKPFSDYSGLDTELYSGNVPHPSNDGYAQLGIRFAGYIQATR